MEGVAFAIKKSRVQLPIGPLPRNNSGQIRASVDASNQVI